MQLPHGRSPKINACTDSYNALLKENVDVGHNNFTRSVYLCVSAEKNTADEALESFTELDEEVKNRFSSLYGYITKPLALEDRLGILRGMYHPGIGEADGIAAGSISYGVGRLSFYCVSIGLHDLYEIFPCLSDVSGG